MSRITQYFLWVCLGLAILIGLTWQFYPLSDAKERLEKLPLTSGSYEGTNVPLSDFEVNFLQGVNVLKRTYKIGDQNLFITGLDGTHNRHIVHDPFYCFRGGGWTLESQKDYPIPGGNATLIEISKGNVKKEALFWFSDGQQNFNSPMKYWMLATLRRLTLGASGPEPVLMVVQPLNQKDVNWEELKEKFPELFNF